MVKKQITYGIIGCVGRTTTALLKACEKESVIIIQKPNQEPMMSRKEITMAVKEIERPYVSKKTRRERRKELRAKKSANNNNKAL